MQVKQISAEKLQREYTVTVPANDVEKKIETKLQELSKTVKMPGFRPGKVPLSVVRKNYGQKVMGEVIQDVIDDSTRQALDKESIRPAQRPNIEIKEFEEGKDLIYSLKLEILPEIPTIDYGKISIERYEADVQDKDLKQALERIAETSKHFEPVKRAAKNGDAVKIDFEGFVNDVAFPGGKAEGHTLELGSNSFIPGFEDQLVGTKAGDEKDVNVTFPKEYHSDDLAGKDAVFKVKVHEVLEAAPREIDDELAQSFGLENKEKLEEAIRQQIENEVAMAVRTRAKKDLFDALEDACNFDVPQGMKDQEFDSIWKKVEEAKKQEPDNPEFKKSDKELKEEYQAMAERRVKLGILLSELGKRENIQVTQDELNSAVMMEARQYPGQEQKVLEHYQAHPEHIEMLKGPIVEEKVVDLIFEQVKTTTKKVSIEELNQLANDDEPRKKKAAAKKKPTAKKDGDKKPAAKKKTTKKKDDK